MKRNVKYKGLRKIFSRVSLGSKWTLYLLIALLVLGVPTGILAFHNNNSTSLPKNVTPKVGHTKTSPPPSSNKPDVAAETSNNIPSTSNTVPKVTPRATSTPPAVNNPINACNNLLSQYYSAYNQFIKDSLAEHQQILTQLKTDYDNGEYGPTDPADPDAAQAYNDYQADVDKEFSRWGAKNKAVADNYNSLLLSAGCNYQI